MICSGEVASICAISTGKAMCKETSDLQLKFVCEKQVCKLEDIMAVATELGTHLVTGEPLASQLHPEQNILCHCCSIVKA